MYHTRQGLEAAPIEDLLRRQEESQKLGASRTSPAEYRETTSF